MPLKTQNKNADLKWNFVMGVIHGTFYTGGYTFGNPNTILPVFLNNLTTSKVLIGLSSTITGSLGGLSGVLPQLFVANILENKDYKRPFLRGAIAIRTICWGLLSLITYLFAVSHPNLTMLSLFFLLFLFTFMGGVATIPFYDIWGKVLPSNLRGRFFGYRQLLGSVLAIGSGFLTKYILGNKNISFPQNFSILFFLAFILIGISYLGLGSVKEPVEEVHKNRLKFKDFLKKSLRILKNDSNYRKFLLVEILIGGSAMALPFYVIYAKNLLHVKLEMVGIFLAAQMIGSALSNFFWAYLSDFVGNKKVLQVSALVSLTIPLLAIITTPDLSVLFILLFVSVGFFTAGYSIGKNNFLLDIAPQKDRPAYLSLNGTLTFPVAIFPLIGGIIIQHISYIFLFGTTLLTLLAGFILSYQVVEPREDLSKIKKARINF
jgi:MFS family permease